MKKFFLLQDEEDELEEKPWPEEEGLFDVDDEESYEEEPYEDEEGEPIE